MNLVVRVERQPPGNRPPYQDLPWVLYGRGPEVKCLRCGAVNKRIATFTTPSVYLKHLEGFHVAHEDCPPPPDTPEYF